jgi:hypothetical protein
LAIGLPAVIAVSAGIGLTAAAVDLAAAPRAAAASPRAFPSAAASLASTATLPRADRPGRISKRLKASLLTVSDLPTGYAALLEPSSDDSTAAVDACNEPVKPAPTGKPADNAQVMFLRADDTTIVYESLKAVGKKAARAVVADYADAPRRCPTITVDDGGSKVRMTQSALRIPRLGDASTGVQFVMDMPKPTPKMHGKMVVVAWRDLSVTLLVISMTKPDQQELEKVAATALGKLRRNG